jgi:2',3'-cyclic-nucleotide 2'-phosphodiesterase (5'-nucleotidase family)
MRGPAGLGRFAVLAAFLLAAACVAGETPAAQADQDVLLTFLHVNDVHGHIVPWARDGRDSGGYARLVTVVKEIRAKSQAARCFLIHAGDEFSVKVDLPQTAGTEITGRTKGEANIAAMNALRFDLWTPGNGEFYHGVPNLKARMREAQCATLTANVTLKDTGQHLGKPFVIVQAGPVRVAFFGLCWIRPETLKVTLLALADPVETAKKLVPELRQKADLVVAVTHLGLGHDRRLASAVEGLDLILGAHSHDALPRGELAPAPAGRKVLIAQAGDYLQYLGRVDLRLALKDGKWQVAQTTARLIPLDDKIAPDEDTAKLIESWKPGRGTATATGEKKAAPAERPEPEKTRVPAK